jgi:hypothetical protein
MTDTKYTPEIKKCIDEHTNVFNEKDMTPMKTERDGFINNLQQRYIDALWNAKDKNSKEALTKKYINQVKQFNEKVELAEKEGKELIEEHCTNIQDKNGGKRRTRKVGKKARRSKKNNKKRKGKKSKRIRKRK